MKKGFFAIVLTVFLVPAFLFAGGSRETSATTSSGTAPRVLSVLIDNGQALEGFNAVARAAEAKFNIKVQVELRPGGNEGENIIKTRLATGDMADLFNYNSGSLLQALNPPEYMLDLSGEAFISRLDDSFRPTVSVGSQVFGIPYSSTQAGAWLYNREVFEKLGLSVPHTWAELIETARRIQAAGITPIIGSYKDAWTSQLIFLADYYNVAKADPSFAENYTANKAKYATHPAALRSWEKLAESNQFLNRDFLATTYDGALEMLVNGEGAMYPMLTQALSYLYELYPDEINNIGVFGQPGDDPNDHGLTIWMPSALYINRHSRNADIAKQFVEFYISDEGVALYGSAIRPDGPYAIKGIELPADSYAGVIEMQKYFDEGRTMPALEFVSPLKGASSEQITVEAGAGLKSAAEAAASYDRDVLKQAIQLGLPGWN